MNQVKTIFCVFAIVLIIGGVAVSQSTKQVTKEQGHAGSGSSGTNTGSDQTPSYNQSETGRFHTGLFSER